jgi:hypothetical protein
MQKILIILTLLTLGMGCKGSEHFWRPDSLYTEHSTYDGDQLYNEVGVSGELGNKGVRMDLFAASYADMHGGRDNSAGGGIRFEIPIGGR